ncbi:hypothetical protein Bca4012_003594 [Brassica carinata]|uniref:Uncharacterized protein n=2 Tax=Brassica TaxID=3705 RepID=A0A3P6AIP0_BRAOL|nr:unnamed protein product [Brassica napus]VDC92382.1 unnamed protein product [Brassica oleracea]
MPFQPCDSAVLLGQSLACSHPHSTSREEPLPPQQALLWGIKLTSSLTDGYYQDHQTWPSIRVKRVFTRLLEKIRHTKPTVKAFNEGRRNQ